MNSSHGKTDVEQSMVKYLAVQGIDDELAGDVASWVKDCALSWKVPEAGKNVKPHGIVAFAFGYLIDEYGQKTPGETNRILANKLLEYCRRFQVKAWVQWEIVKAVLDEGVQDDIDLVNDPSRCVPIYPKHDRRLDRLSYLSSWDIAQEVAKEIPPSKEEVSGKTLLVVAHRDHLRRCVNIVQEAGFNTMAFQSKMPCGYYQESAQLWTTSRRLYLMHDAIGRLNALRDKRTRAAEREANSR
jgi:hypothetical protein